MQSTVKIKEETFEKKQVSHYFGRNIFKKKFKSGLSFFLTIFIILSVFYSYAAQKDPPGYLHSNRKSQYQHLSDHEIYRALNWTRDIANPRHTVAPLSSIRDSRVGDTLYIDGKLRPFQYSALQYGKYKGVRRIVLNSLGGIVYDAMKLAEVVREQGLTTVVPANGICMSGCTLVFQAGVKRQAHHSAIFLYHNTRSGPDWVIKHLDPVCQVTDSDDCRKKIEESRQALEKKSEDFLQSYLLYDIDPQLLDLLASLPEQNEEEWMKDGNWSKKVDLVFADNKDDKRIANLKDPYILDPSQLSEFNIVIDWFE